MTGAVPSESRQRRLGRHLGVLALYCLLTAAMIAPLVLDPVTSTPGWEGDNTFCIRQFWWVKHAIVDLHVSPFRDPTTYYPVGHAVANGELFAATTIPAIPITMLWGPVVAYNITLFLTFALTGFGTYLWAAHATGSFGGAIVAGVVAAFLPYRFAHLPGHLHMVSTHWVPFAFYALDRFVDRKSPARAVWFGFCAAMVALSSWYYAYAAALLLSVYALLASRPWRQHWTRAWWSGLAVAAATSSVIVAPFLLPYLRLRSQGGLTRGIGEMETWSLNFYAFALPNRLNPFWREFVQRWFPQDASQWVERGVSLGYTALGLAIFAVVIARRSERTVRHVHALWAVVGVALVSYVVALGPTLHSGDRQVLLPVPPLVLQIAAQLLAPFGSLEPVRAQMLAQQALAVPLPSMFMFVVVPMTSGMRVMARFGVWTGLMVAMLAGWGTALLLERGRAAAGSRLRAIVLVAALVAVVLAESYSDVVMMPLRPRPVDVWLSQQPVGAVVELPIAQAERPLQDYYKTVHEQPTVFGPIGDGFMPAMLAERRALLAEFPTPEGVEALREWGTRYVLFSPAEIPDWAALKERLGTAPGLWLQREVGGVQVYAVE